LVVERIIQGAECLANDRLATKPTVATNDDARLRSTLADVLMDSKSNGTGCWAVYAGDDFEQAEGLWDNNRRREPAAK
jgi:hypothetical protein